MISAGIHILLICYTQSFEIELELLLNFLFLWISTEKLQSENVRFANSREHENARLDVFDACLDDIMFFCFF